MLTMILSIVLILSVVGVYAAAYTKLPGADKWTELVHLTKGTANANNYSGYGGANSFNTDTWKSDSGKTIAALANQTN